MNKGRWILETADELGLSEVKKVLKISDDSGLWPLVREKVPSKLRYWVDAYSSHRNSKAPNQSILQGLTAIRYNALPADGRGPHFRLLKILQRQSGGRIQCELEEHAIGNAPPYHALSYCWGTEDAKVTILCNDSELLLTPSLASALSRLRLRGCQYVWIDALCINQKDKAERQQQVGIMQQIYLRAFEVCVWLGEDDRHIPLTIRGVPFGSLSEITFRFLRACAKQSRGGSQFPDPRRSSVGNGLEVYHEGNKLRILKLALRHILQRPWFDRVWCVQEVLMNPKATLICGSNEISWHTFRKGLASAVQVDTISGRFFRAISRDSVIVGKLHGLAEYEEPLVEDNAASYLFRLLVRYRAKRSTDPRDKMYALFGIVKYFFNEFDLTPSYEVSLAEAYKRTATYILRHTQDLRIFAACDGRVVPEHHLALSWVPDWSCVEHVPETFQDLGTNQVQYYAASKGSSAKASSQSDGMGLNLQGRISDSIENVGDVLPLNTLYGVENGGRLTLPDILGGKVDPGPGQEFKDYTMDFGLASLQYMGLAYLGLSQNPFDSSQMEHKSDSSEFAPNPYDHFKKARLKFLVKQTQVCLDWKEMATSRSTRDRYGNEKNREVAYWKTLCAGKLCEDQVMTANLYELWQRSLNRLDFALKHEIDAWHRYDLEDDEGQEGEMTRWEKAVKDAEEEARKQQLEKVEAKWKAWQRDNKFGEMLKYAYNRRFARTSKGYFSLVPASTKKGDFVGIFSGSDVPLIIREFGEDWKLVGQGYVHGIMHGEAYDEGACKKFTFR